MELSGEPLPEVQGRFWSLSSQMHSTRLGGAVLQDVTWAPACSRSVQPAAPESPKTGPGQGHILYLTLREQASGLLQDLSD